MFVHQMLCARYYAFMNSFYLHKDLISQMWELRFGEITQHHTGNRRLKQDSK